MSEPVVHILDDKTGRPLCGFAGRLAFFVYAAAIDRPSVNKVNFCKNCKRRHRRIS